MTRKIRTWIFTIIMTIAVSACNATVPTNEPKNPKAREIILRNDNTNSERNRLLTADLLYFQKEFPKRHPNPFTQITKATFDDRMTTLIANVEKKSNIPLFVELNQLIASVGDAHTTINYWDGYHYPLKFWLFDRDVYVVNADQSLKDMLFTKVVKINNVDIQYVVQALTTLISHENEAWVSAMLPQYLQSPGYLVGLGLMHGENETVFTVQKDGKDINFTVKALPFEAQADFVNQKTTEPLVGVYEKYYNYTYLPDEKTVYFVYNVCGDDPAQSFKDWNQEMFESIQTEAVHQIVVDLRNNSGGDSEVLNPFVQSLEKYVQTYPQVEVYILVGRNTFSSGMLAIRNIKLAVPDAIAVGEPTGGALDHFGDVRTFALPNVGIVITYSTKYFNISSDFPKQNLGENTFLPDVRVKPSIEDYKNGTDAVLKVVLKK